MNLTLEVAYLRFRLAHPVEVLVRLEISSIEYKQPRLVDIVVVLHKMTKTPKTLIYGQFGAI